MKFTVQPPLFGVGRSVFVVVSFDFGLHAIIVAETETDVKSAREVVRASGCSDAIWLDDWRQTHAHRPSGRFLNDCAAEVLLVGAEVKVNLEWTFANYVDEFVGERDSQLGFLQQLFLLRSELREGFFADENLAALRLVNVNDNDGDESRHSLIIDGRSVAIATDVYCRRVRRVLDECLYFVDVHDYSRAYPTTSIP